MKTREERIQFDMNYCQHYQNGKGADMVCTAGVDLKTFQRVPTGSKGIKWGPCIEGHTLDNPTSHCPHWIRRTREMGELLADSIQRSIDMMKKAEPFITEWRKKKPIGKQEVVTCPVCGSKLHLIQASYNGHVHAHCETDKCIRFTE